MDNLLKKEIVGILNTIQRGDAPKLESNELKPASVEIAEYRFDLIDSKDGSPIRPFESGTAHYINGTADDNYQLKIVCYDDYLHQFYLR